jgi:hypothetical protein
MSLHQREPTDQTAQKIKELEKRILVLERRVADIERKAAV